HAACNLLYILAIAQIEGDLCIAVCLHRLRDLGGLLIDHNHRFPKLSDLSQARLQNGLCSFGLLLLLAEDVVAFLDDQRMLEALPIWFPLAILVEPEDQSFGKKALVDVGESIELQHNGPRKQLRRIEFVVGVHDTSEPVPKAQAFKHPQSGGLPELHSPHERL